MSHHILVEELQIQYKCEEEYEQTNYCNVHT
jgi:hypothetical protein